MPHRNRDRDRDRAGVRRAVPVRCGVKHHATALLGIAATEFYGVIVTVMQFKFNVNRGDAQLAEIIAQRGGGDRNSAAQTWATSTTATACVFYF